jgi:hypothetical protein
MKTILLSYANAAMDYSLKMIGKQAKRLGLFDKIILETPKGLPAYIEESPLMQYKIGGGYWAWKPAIIWETLKNLEENDILLYVDAGCTLQKRPEWNDFFNLLKRHDVIVFQYKDSMEEWAQWGQTSTKIKYWTKKKALVYFSEKDPNYGNYNKILAGIIFIKKTAISCSFIQEWLNLTLIHPELIINPTKEEKKEQESFFVMHRNDQCVITALAHQYAPHVKVMTETSETEHKRAAIVASRVRAATFREYWTIRLKHYLREELGDTLFEKIKKHICRS